MQKNPVASRIQQICKPTIWQTVVALVHETKGVNLSQGAPELGPQPFFVSNMLKASQERVEQQCDADCLPELRKTIAEYHGRQYKNLDQNKNIAITSGASAALYFLYMAFIDPGDEVLLFQPAFDFYHHYATIFQVKTKSVKLISNDKKTRKQIKQAIQDKSLKPQIWQIDWLALENNLTEKTKIIILNSPQNPTGKVFTQDQIDKICQMALKFQNLIIVEDSVYEGFMFDQFKGKPLPKVIYSKYYPDLKQRVVNVYSAGKLLQATGIRCGWVLGPQKIISLLKTFHKQLVENITFMIQKATIYSLQDIIRQEYYYLDLQASRLETHREQLLKTLSESKYDFRISLPQSGYFILVDISHIQIQQKYMKFRLEEGQQKNLRDLAFCYQMAFQDGVIFVPCSTFFSSSQNLEENTIRFALCKSIQAIRLAKQKLSE